MGRRLGLKNITHAERMKFRDELSDIVTGFGYKWQFSSNNVILDLKRRNPQANNFESFIGGLLDRVSAISTSPRRSYKLMKHTDRLRDKLTYAKGPAMKEIFADLFLIGVFSYILKVFLSSNKTIVESILSLFVISVLTISLVTQFRDLLLDDATLLRRKYGFEKYKNGYGTNGEHITTKMMRSKYQGLLYSLAFLIVAVLSIVSPYPPLVFFSNVINFTALILVSFSSTLQILRNKVFERVGISVSNTKIVAILSYIFLAIFIASSRSAPALILTINRIFVDILVLSSFPLIVRDILRYRNFKTWISYANQGKIAITILD